jgi:vancomycin aglycone glucosyltransferase
VALATELKARGQDVRLCVPPDFCEWISGLGLSVVPIGPELRTATAPTIPVAPSAPPALPSSERRRALAEATVAAQFETLASAAADCDVIVGATALQIAARSVAERKGVPYVFVAYSPVVLPSPHHAPPPLPIPGLPPPGGDNRELWARDALRFHDTFGAALNAHRGALGLPPVDDVRRHVFTERPWLAADAALAPWPDPLDPAIVQTGAWILPDDRPGSPELEAFLEAGDPPLYFGFGSTRAPQDLARVMVEAARAHGRRAIVSQGWANLSLGVDSADCLLTREANVLALFPRVAAVVHHGGAGTTTAAALGGAPQVVIPQVYDQHYWAARVRDLGLGAAHAPGAPTADSLAAALGRALETGVSARARDLAAKVRRDGASFAAERLIDEAR